MPDFSLLVAHTRTCTQEAAARNGSGLRTAPTSHSPKTPADPMGLLPTSCLWALLAQP